MATSLGHTLEMENFCYEIFMIKLSCKSMFVVGTTPENFSCCIYSEIPIASFPESQFALALAYAGIVKKEVVWLGQKDHPFTEGIAKEHFDGSFQMTRCTCEILQSVKIFFDDIVCFVKYIWYL